MYINCVYVAVFVLFFQSLSHCELVTDDGIRHLGVSTCATETLQVLELDNCPLITDASLEYLQVNPYS